MVTIYESKWRQMCSLIHFFGLLSFAAILGVHTLVTSRQTYDGTASKEGYNSKFAKETESFSFEFP